MIDREVYFIPSIIDDPSSLDEIKELTVSRGIIKFCQT